MRLYSVAIVSYRSRSWLVWYSFCSCHQLVATYLVHIHSPRRAPDRSTWRQGRQRFRLPPWPKQLGRSCSTRATRRSRRSCTFTPTHRCVYLTSSKASPSTCARGSVREKDGPRPVACAAFIVAVSLATTSLSLPCSRRSSLSSCMW